MPTVPKPRWRRWRFLAAAVVAAGLALLAGLHVPLARARVLTWVSAELATRGLRVEARRLDYNLFTLTVGLDRVTAAAAGDSAPFFEADAVRLNLPLAALRGALRVQSLEVDRPRVRIVRRADGSWNLPRSSSTSEGPLLSGPLDAGHVIVRDLTVEYADAIQGVGADGRGLGLDLSRAAGGDLAGRLTMSGGLAVRQGDRTTTLSRLDGTLSFDGRTISIGALDLAASEGQVRIAGSVGPFTAEPRLDLSVDGALDVDRVSTWLDVSSRPAGRVAVKGRVTGPFATPRAEIAASGQGIAWPAIGALSVDARATIGNGAVDVAALRLGIASGEVEATGRVALDATGRSDADIRWRRVDVGALARTGAALPVHPAAIADGHLVLSWTGRDLIGARGRLAASLRPPAARAAGLPLSGRIEAAVEDRRWTLTADTAAADAVILAGTVGGRLEETLSASTLNGRTTIRADDIDRALRTLREAGLDVGSVAIAGNARAAIDIGGTFAAPRAAGTIDADGLTLEGTGPATASLRFNASPARVALEQARVTLDTNVITAAGGLDVSTRGLSGQFDGKLANLSALGAALPELWRPDGAGTIGGRLGGTLTNPSVDLTLATDRVRVAGQSIDAVRSTLRFAGRTVTVTAFEAAQNEGRLNATGQYALDSRTYAIDATGTNLAFEDTPLRARGNLRVSGAGPIDRPEATGTIDLPLLEWGQYSLAPIRADVTLANGRLQTRAAVPSLGGRIDGTVDLDARTISATAAVVNADLSTLTPGVRDDAVQLAGSVSFRASANGPLDDLAAIAVGVDLSAVDATVNGVPVRLARPATLRREAETIAARDLELRLGESAITASGRLGAPPASGEALRLDLKGSVRDFMALAGLGPDVSTVDASGAVVAHLTATGPVRAPEVTATLAVTDGAVQAGSLPPVTGISVAADYADGRVHVRQITGLWQGAEVAATAGLPIGVLGRSLPPDYVASLSGAAGPATATVKVSAITSEAIAPFVDRATVDQIAGRIDLVANLQAASLDLDSLAGTVTLDRAEMEVARVPVRQAEPTRLRLANRRIAVESWHWTGAGSLLDVTGSARLTDEAPDLDLRLAGTVDMRMLAAFVPDVAVAGRANVDVRASGPATDPRVEGAIAVADTDVIVRNPRIAITGLQGDAVLTGHRLQLRGLTAAANGGDLRVEGTIDFGGSSPSGGALTVTGRGMAFEPIEGLRTDLDADLILGMANGERTIGGRVTILRGDYRRRLRLTDLLGRSGTAAVTPPTSEPGPLDDVRLDIAIGSADDIVVDNNYGRFEVSSQLTLVGTVAEPALAGRLALREGGRVFLSGRSYDVRRGTIAFTNPTRIEPQLDVALATRVQQNDITLEVTGTPDALEVGLRSPGLSQQDAVSLLLTGQRADDSTIAYSDVAQGQLLMLLSGEILGAAGQAVGLDSVRVSQGLGAAASTFDLLSTESSPDARLTLSKKLRRDVELIVSQNLRESGDITWILAYQPTRRLDLRATTDDSDNQTYEFRHEVPFGGGAGPAREAVRASTPPARVTGVEIRGAPASLARDLRDELRLGEGDRFDFYEWQDDRDRLLRLLREGGFLEARVAARRQDGGPDTMHLTYEITAGPHATLEVDGFTLPASSLAEMKAAWADALFDEFLKEDLTTIARRALVTAGYMKSEVVTTIRQPGASEKAVFVSITPGPRSAARRIEFEGNRAVSSAALTTAVDDYDLEVEGWLDRTRLGTTLVEVYRSLGYLGASVIVDPATFEGADAILPVRIDEGPQHRVGDVRVDGAASLTADDVRTAFALQPGAAYLPSTVEPARRRVEAAYLRRGYNDARVRVATDAEPAQALVHVSVSVEAGPQQVLEAIDVTGAEVTSQAVINRVLKLPVGEPVGLGDVFSAQKRLYDTGVFQSVDLSLVPAADAPSTGGVQPVHAEITLRELPRFRLRYGFRITDSVEPGGELRQVQPGFVTDLLDRNLFGRAIAAGVAGQVESDRALGRVFFSLPSLFGRAVVTNVYLTQSREEIARASETPFVDRSLEFTTEQKLKPRSKMAVTYGLSFSRKHVYESNPDPESLLPPLDLRTNITRLTGTYAWDTRDDPSDASRGWFHSSGAEYGVEPLGSDLRFVRYLAQQFYMKRATKRMVLASAIRLGAARGFEQELIPSERFYAGGGTSVRGFAEDGLGAEGVLGDPAGGNGLLVLNQELRVRAHRWFGAVAFIDAGNVFPRASDISFTNLEAGAGFGLRVISPFAILRVDFGIPLTSRRTQPSGRWYFGIGHTF